MSPEPSQAPIPFEGVPLVEPEPVIEPSPSASATPQPEPEPQPSVTDPSNGQVFLPPPPDPTLVGPIPEPSFVPF
ncbi:MAG: hypothetical protein M0R06_02175 [Sphaerochaeta sp.]|nr:hypothetical protein [Sphaerochaeta sp.]